MKLETKLKAYELLIADLETKLEKACKDVDANASEEVAVNEILMNEIFRLSGYANLMAVAKRIDAEVYGGKRNYEDLVWADYSEEVAA